LRCILAESGMGRGGLTIDRVSFSLDSVGLRIVKASE
jgi:hypothetical protein